MLQSITENNKKNEVNNKKLAEIDSNAAKNVPTKKTSEHQDKGDLAKKTIENVDKTVSGTTIKN